jgi:hypothetical protein
MEKEAAAVKDEQKLWLDGTRSKIKLLLDEYG